MRLSIIDDQASSSTQPVELLTAIVSQPSLPPASNRTPDKRSQSSKRPGPRKHPIAVAPCWVPLPAATPSKARRCRTVEFKLGVFSRAEHGRVDDGNGGQRKATCEEVRVRFGLKQRNQVSKRTKVYYKIIKLSPALEGSRSTYGRGMCSEWQRRHLERLIVIGRQGQQASVATRDKPRTRGVSGHGWAGYASRGRCRVRT